MTLVRQKWQNFVLPYDHEVIDQEGYKQSDESVLDERNRNEVSNKQVDHEEDRTENGQ